MGLHEIADRMSEKVRGDGVRFALYSGHDTSVLMVVTALGLSNCFWEPFASHVVFELWTSPESAAVRIFFNGRLATSGIPACAGADFCPLKAFREALQELLDGHESWE